MTPRTKTETLCRAMLGRIRPPTRLELFAAAYLESRALKFPAHFNLNNCVQKAADGYAAWLERGGDRR